MKRHLGNNARRMCAGLVCSGAVAFAGLPCGAEPVGSDSPDEPAASEEGIEYLHNAVIYDGAVGTMPVAVMLSSRPFDPSVHQIAKVECEEDNWLLDGNRIRGADGLPKKGFPQMSGLMVRFGDTTVSVPEKHLLHFFNPNGQPAEINPFGIATGQVTFSSDGSSVDIELALGDGWVSATTRFLIASNGLVIPDAPHHLNDVVVYEGAANGVAIKVTASTRPFRYARHKVGKRTGNEWESDGSDTWRATIDGEPAIGTMGNEPHEGDSQLVEVVVRIGGKTVRIPAERLAHVISPQLHQIPGGAGPTVTASANGKVVQVEIPAGRDKSLPILVSDDGQFQFIRAYNPGP